jgi:hypothetical protein
MSSSILPITTGSSEITLTGTDTMSQALTGIVLVFLMHITLAAAEFIYTSFSRMWTNRIELFPDTYPSGSKMFTAIQNPTNPNAKTIYVSENQRTGIEFSYSLFLKLSSETFSESNRVLYHILHKGYNRPFPLLGPGIFCRGDKNTLRIYMNSFSNWNNYVEIDNIPVDKWFHLVVTCKGGTKGVPESSVLYIYINGNLKQKLKLNNNTPPYQNYGNVYAFSSRNLVLNKTQTNSLYTDPEISSDSNLTGVTFSGSAKGMISRVYYYRYALSYTEINSLMNLGPSPNMVDTPDNTITPYLTQTWWTNNGTRYD